MRRETGKSKALPLGKGMMKMVSHEKATMERRRGRVMSSMRRSTPRIDTKLDAIRASTDLARRVLPLQGNPTLFGSKMVIHSTKRRDIPSSAPLMHFVPFIFKTVPV